MFKMILLLTTWMNASASDVVELKYPLACTLEVIAEHMGIALGSEPLPEIRVASQTTLSEFQDDVEPQWGIRPEVVVNVYVVSANRIYLLDDASYYGKYGRTIDDSLAHELVHYLQVRYQKMDRLDGEAAEYTAVMEQNWFRENYMAKGVSPCR